MATGFDDLSDDDMRLPDAGSILSVDVSVHDDGLTVSVTGELDFSNAERLIDAIGGIELDGHRSVALDLTDLTFCDVRGAAALHHVNERIRSVGGRLTVRGASGLPRQILILTGVDQALEIE